MTAPPRLDLQHVSKRYPGVLANDDVSLQVAAGSLHAVLGENGAGKSTLMKMIYGSVKPDQGVMHFNGNEVRIRDPRHARALGISMVFQHFSLFDSTSVAENVWLGLDQRLTLAEVSQRIRDKAQAYGLPIDPEQPVHSLSTGEMQRVEIIRALLTEPQLLILDEPTSVLTPQAVDKLFVVLRQLASEGCSILYISHKLHEIRALCEVCTVMRGGRVTGVCDPRQESNASLSRMMLGAEPPPLAHRPVATGAVALQWQHHDGTQLQVRAGEIVGIAGVSGNGQKALLEALSGETPSAAHAMQLLGVPAGSMGPAARRALGLHYVPEERLGHGAVPNMSLMLNMLLTREQGVGRGGLLRPRAMSAQAQHVVQSMDVKTPSVHTMAGALSGGNLQKFLVGREIDAQPKVLVIAQPTWGVDVGAASRIRSELLRLREQGTAVLVISEELDELFELADRLHVIAGGRLSPAVARQDASVEQIGQWMAGLWPEQTHAAV
jgi:ABC-type uncharacterized transport system ATPase subunit